MQSSLIHRQRSLLDHLGQRRVSMTRASEILCAGRKLHRQGRLGDQLRDPRSDHVDAEDAVGFLVGQDLDQSFLRAQGPRASVVVLGEDTLAIGA